MVSSKFKLQVYLRVFLLILAILLFSYTLIVEKLYITSSVLLLVVVLFIMNILHFITQTNRSVSRFIDAIRQRDFMMTFSPAQKDSSFKDLSDSFNVIIDTFRSLSAEKEAQHLYLKTVVENIPSAIISFDNNGDVQLINEKFKEIFNAPYIKNIESLNRYDDNIVENFRNIKNNENILLRIRVKDELLNLSVGAVYIKLNQKSIKTLTLTDIRKELDNQEVESWQKLIRVLTHEIMNSLSPVTSLSSSLTTVLEENGKVKSLNNLSEEDISDTLTGIKTITKRGEGLMDFVKSYRSLIKIPKPNFEKVSVAELVNNIKSFLEPDCVKKGVKLKIDIEDEFELLIDEKLIEQVLINLVKNASESLSEESDKSIRIKAFKNNEKFCISVTDKGCGIETEEQEKIFIPFYSTKEKGSGIGLSLSRQIMQMHNSKIEVLSEVGFGTIVILVF
jgi:two-component system nitrogen regulation sensor histidine kinase NtrY